LKAVPPRVLIFVAGRKPVAYSRDGIGPPPGRRSAGKRNARNEAVQGGPRLKAGAAGMASMYKE
jgi:hypothetical protein